MTDAADKPDYSKLSAVFINCTLTPSPKVSHTETLMTVVRDLMSAAGVSVESFRSVGCPTQRTFARKSDVSH